MKFSIGERVSLNKGALSVSYIACRSFYTNMYEGKTGKVIDSIMLDGAIESSPIAVDNNLIIGTRGGYIYCITLK